MLNKPSSTDWCKDGRGLSSDSFRLCTLATLIFAGVALLSDFNTSAEQVDPEPTHILELE